MAEKKYTHREAAVAILQKAEEMMKSSILAKADEDRSKMSGKSGMVALDSQANQNQTGVHQHGYKGSSGGISEAGANVRDAAHSGGSAKDKHLANAKHFHQQALAEQKAMPHPNLPEPGGTHTSPALKGPVKLATFMGRMDHKRKSKAAPAAAPAAPGKPKA